MDLDPHTGIRPGERWRQALQQANTRCEAVICLLSKHWEASRECQTEFRYAENLGKTILCARLEPVPDTNITSEWQRCDLFPDHGATTACRPRRWRAAGGVDYRGHAAAAGGAAGLGHRGRAFSLATAGRPRPRSVPGVGTAGGSGCGGVLRARRPDPARPGRAARAAQLGGGVPVRHPRPVRGGQVVISAGGSAAPDAPRRPPLPSAAHRAAGAGGAHRGTRRGSRHPPTAHRSRVARAGAGGDQERLPGLRRAADAGLAGGGPPSRACPAARRARRAARPHPGAAAGSGRGTVQRRRRTRGPLLLEAAGGVGRPRGGGHPGDGGGGHHPRRPLRAAASRPGVGRGGNRAVRPAQTDAPWRVHGRHHRSGPAGQRRRAAAERRTGAGGATACRDRRRRGCAAAVGADAWSGCTATSATTAT